MGMCRITIPKKPEKSYDTGFPTEPIGGMNPYYRCVHCKRSVPEINGDILKHETWCEYRKQKTWQ
jgi:hypothetical protein